MASNFTKEKQDFLSKKDKSRKGGIDLYIVELVNHINSLDSYYTTSSCAGRIVLLEKRSEKKQQSGWLINKHGEITSGEILSALKEKSHTGEIWLKQEPLILHVRCRDLVSAKNLLDISHPLFKRSGIISISDKGFVIEIIGNKRIDCIIGDKGNVFADEKFIRETVGYANRNFGENQKNIQRFFSRISI